MGNSYCPWFDKGFAVKILMQKDDGTVRKTRQTLNIVGQAHELTFSCYNHLPLLSKDRTRQWFIEALDQARRKWSFEIWAYVVMPEHVHLLILPTSAKYQMSLILKAIKQSVSRRAVKYLRDNFPLWLEKLKVTWPDGRVEYRFWQQGCGYDRNIENAKIAWASILYIHNNPVRKGLVDSPVKWEWSSAQWYAGENNVKLPIEGCPLEVMKS